MSDLKKLVEKDEHVALSQVENKDYQSIAHIHLEHYKKALGLTKKGSFEHCYCLYKLKKYNKCVKGLNKIQEKEDKHNLLLGQALYNLGYYNKALDIFSKYKNSTSLINAEAIVSFINASKMTKNIQRYKVTCKDVCYSYNEADYDFTEEERREFEYNRTFAMLYDEDSFVKELEKSFDNPYCRNQLYNVTGNFEELDSSHLTKKQKEIVSYNKNGGNVDGLMHFQKVNAEYKYFRNNKHTQSGLVKDYLMIKKWDESRKRGKNKRFDINRIKDNDLKQMMDILTRKKSSQEELKEILTKYK